MRTSVSLIRGAALVLTLLLLGAPQPASAQFGKRLKDAVKRTAEDTAIDKATTKEAEAIDAATGDAPAGAPQETGAAPAAGGEAAAPEGGAAAAAPGAGAAAPKLWLNYDFVPGDRVLYYNDYSEDQVGNFPERLEFQSGNMEIAELGGQRYIRASATGVFSIPLPEVLPDKFTIEIDAIHRKSPDGAAFHLNGGPKRDISHESTVIQWGTDGVGVVGGKGGVSPMTNDDANRTRYGGKPAQIKILGDGKYIKVFMDERRLANIPNTNFARANSLTFTVEGMSQENPVYIGKIRVAASRKSIYDDLAAKGRISTQGILFATGSDQVRPESGATLKEIAEMMKGHPDLRIRIEGHTDNVGKKDANLALSERRAAAVKALLEKDFQIDAARMESQGFGDTQPAAKNDTPEGRQNNRRVELVKL
jgi:outer membrane protein OmpA-like peptidoglycan-associated protein